MKTNHLIDNAIFDITYGHQEIAFDQRSEIDLFVKNDLMAVVDEVFNETTRPGLVLRIPFLEIDLGDIPYRYYQHEMPRILREQLVSILGEIRHIHKSGQASNNILLDEASAEEEQLFYFLRTGNLPWYSRLSGPNALELLLMRMINTSPEKFNSFISTTSQKETVIERLVNQFSDNAIMLVCQVLSSSQSNDVQQLGRIIKNLLIDISTTSFRQTNEQAISESGQVSIYAQEGDGSRGGHGGHVANVDKMHGHLISALLSGDDASIQYYWAVLYCDHAQILVKTLRYYGQQAKVRKHIVSSFSKIMLHDLVVLLEPSEHGFVQAIIDHAELFQSDNNSKSSDQFQQKAEVWECTLAYLLVEGGSRFNKKSYLASLIKQMALLGNQSQSYFLINLTENIATIPKSNKLIRYVLEYINEIRHDLSISIEQQERKRVEQLASYLEYERLKSALTGTGYDIKRNESVLLKDIEALSHKTPWLLMRLFRELQVGAYSLNLAIDNFSIPSLRQLVHALLSLTSHADPARQSDLISAIQTNAEKVRDIKSYYINILECLINGEWIDFDVLEVVSPIKTHEKSDTSHTATQPTGITQNRTDHVDITVNEQVTIEQAKQMIADSLYSDQPLSGKALADIIRLFDLMHDQQPMMLRQLLGSGMNDKHFISRLLELFPERLQVKLFSMMELDNHASILQCAELLNMACYAQETGIQEKQLTRLKWQFIYSYIADTGRLFNEKYFVHQYVETLMTQVKHTDALQFRSILSQQLLKNSLPSTREITQRLIESIAYDADNLHTPAASDSTKTIESDRAYSDEQAVVEDIYIENAGIVLAAPYLPRLFDMLGLTEKSAFKDREAAARGVHILQFLVNESISSPEYQLVLNKILCGVKPGRPIKRGIELSEQEKDQLESLLLGMIQHWKSLGNTSTTGLRESFLQRHGRLQLKDDAWHLSVEAKSFDMLLDQIPWSYSTIKFPWMDRVIYVEWR